MSLMMLLPGTYEVYLQEGESSPRWLGTARLVAGSVTTLAPEESKPGRIRVHVQTAANRSLAGASVVAAFAAYESKSVGQRRIRAVSNSEGLCEISDVCPGRWIIYPESLGAQSTHSVTVDVTPGKSADAYLTCDPPGRIEGHVRRNGTSVPLAQLVLEPLGEGMFGRYKLEARTDSQGYYAFDAVQPGAYDLGVTLGDPSSPHATALYRHVVLAPDETVTVDFDPESNGVMVIVQRDGAPFTRWDGGMVLTTGGASWLRQLPTDPSCATCASIDPGPVLLMLGTSRHVPVLDPRSSPRAFYAVYVHSVPLNARQISASIDGADVVVRTATTEAVMPYAQLIEMGPYRSVFGSQAPYQLAYVDESDNVRRFQAVPVGARIVLRSTGGNQVGPELHTTIQSTAEVSLSWPPKD